jgi:hypothetical protein
MGAPMGKDFGDWAKKLGVELVACWRNWIEF